MVSAFNRAEKEMPTEITQLDDQARGVTTLRVKGEMKIADALLLQRIAAGIHTETGNRIIIDIAELELLDSESAPFLRDLGEAEGFEIEGTEIFLQTAIDQAERRDRTTND